jgi:hypothetical protein
MAGSEQALDLEALAALVEVLRVRLRCDHAALARWQDGRPLPVVSVGRRSAAGGGSEASARIAVDGHVWGRLTVAGADPIDPALVRWASECAAEALTPPVPSVIRSRPPRQYELRIRGQLSPALAASFAPLDARFEEGHTVLRGVIANDAQLYRHVRHARAVGVGLVSLMPVLAGV